MAPTHNRRQRTSIDAKWLAHVALARKNGDPVAFSSMVETRNFRQLTARRKRMVEEFMNKFQANQSIFGQYGSETWINALIKHLTGSRHGVLPLDVENWLATESYFKKYNRIFRYGAGTAEDHSDGTDDIDGQPADAAAAATIDDNVEMIDLTENPEGTTSETNPTSTFNEGAVPEDVDRAEASIPPPENHINQANTTQNLDFQGYVNGMYNHIVQLMTEGRTDISNLELQCFFHVVSAVKLLLDNNAGRT